MPAELYQYKLPSPRWGWREGLILHWNDGWGEIAPLPGFSTETFHEAKAEILSLLPHLKSAQPKHPSVQFGLACASTAFNAASLTVPLCALNQPRPGFITLKLKLGHLPFDQAIAHTKKYVGKYSLRIDCNRKWTWEEALRFADAFEPNDFEYLEEPLDTFDNLVRFSETTRFPLAVDESIKGFPIFSIPTLKALVVKPTILGSIPTPPLGIDVVLSSAYETSLGLLQIARRAKSNTIAHGLDTLENDLLEPGIKTEDGFLHWSPDQNPSILKDRLCLIATAP